MSNRLERISELLKRELSQAIDREMEFTNSLVTIHDVKVAPDLRQADVFIGVIGGGAGSERNAIEKLEANRGPLQARIAKRVILKYTPRLHFHADHSIERGVRVVSLLDQIAETLPDDDDPESKSETADD